MTRTLHHSAIACASLLAVACASPKEESAPQPERTSQGWPQASKADQVLLEKLNAVRASNTGVQAIIRPSHGWHVRCDLTSADDVLVLFGVGEAESPEHLVGAWGNEGAAKEYSAGLDKVTASGDFLMRLNTGNEPIPVWLVVRSATAGGDLESPIAWKAVQPAEGLIAAYAFEFEPRAGPETPQVIVHVRDVLLVDIRM